MTAIEKLNKLAADLEAACVVVRKNNPTMAKSVALMQKHGARSIEDAITAEAYTLI